MSNPALTRALNLSQYRSEKVSGFEFYVAETSEQHANGLSGLSSLDKDGMLFVFANPTGTPFHMADMQVDLDIAFYNHDGGLIKQGTYSKHYRGPIFSPSPYSYVVEAVAAKIDFSALDITEMVRAQCQN